MNTPLLNPRQAAEKLGITIKGLRAMVAARSVPFIALSARRIRFEERDLEQLVKRMKTRAACE